MISVILFLALISDPSMLFVGNSYTFANGGLWMHAKEIYDSVETDTLSVASHSSGGATFENHWNNQSLIELIETGNWNFIVFQEQSCMPVINPSQTYLYGDSLAWLTAANSAEPVFLMTWARMNDPLMLEGLDLGYSRMGFAHSSPVPPSGRAFELSRIEFPDIDLYASDGAHPSSHGSYLAACVIVHTVFATDLSASSVWKPADITEEDAEKLRSVALQACLNYLQPGGS